MDGSLPVHALALQRELLENDAPEHGQEHGEEEPSEGRRLVSSNLTEDQSLGNLQSVEMEDRCGVHEGRLISTRGCSRYGRFSIVEITPPVGRHATTFVHFAESQLLLVAYNVLLDTAPVRAHLAQYGISVESDHSGGVSGILGYHARADGGLVPFASLRLDGSRTEVNPSVACKGPASATGATAYFGGQTSPGTIYRVEWNPSSSSPKLRVTGVLDLQRGDDKVWSLT